MKLEEMLTGVHQCVLVCVHAQGKDKVGCICKNTLVIKMILRKPRFFIMLLEATNEILVFQKMLYHPSTHSFFEIKSQFCLKLSYTPLALSNLKY